MDEMARHSIDDRTADRLLSGAIVPDDAPPGYEQVARMVRAAQAPTTAAELSREQSVVSMAAAAVSSLVSDQAAPGSPHRRKKKVISKLATVRAAAITAAAVLGAGAAAAAATGSLPSQSASSSHAAGVVSAGSNTGSGTSGASGNSQTGGNPNPGSSNPLGLPTTGPANFHAVVGLCRAFLAHNSTTTTAGAGSGTAAPLNENNSTAFQALRKDATGSTTGSLTATAAWCTNYLSKYSPGKSGSTPDDSTAPGKGAPDNGTAPAGKPASPGNSGSHSGGKNDANHSGITTPPQSTSPAH